MKMRVQVCDSADALNKGHRPGLAVADFGVAGPADFAQANSVLVNAESMSARNFGSVASRKRRSQGIVSTHWR
jgi:hypothetical protein